MKRETLRVLALLGAGWFIHDAIWHALLVAFGMNGMVAMEFSLPDLGPLGIRPDPAIQTMALLISIVLAGALLFLEWRLRRPRQLHG